MCELGYVLLPGLFINQGDGQKRQCTVAEDPGKGLSGNSSLCHWSPAQCWARVSGPGTAVTEALSELTNPKVQKQDAAVAGKAPTIPAPLRPQFYLCEIGGSIYIRDGKL